MMTLRISLFALVTLMMISVLASVSLTPPAHAAQRGGDFSTTDRGSSRTGGGWQGGDWDGNGGFQAGR